MPNTGSDFKHHNERISAQDPEEFIAKHLGDPYRQYREDWHRPETTRQPLDFPIHLDFELTDCCNKKCVMCPRNQAIHSSLPFRVNTGARLEFDLFARTIDQAVAHGTRSINLGAFAEPLLNPDVFRFIRYAHDKGILDSILITNGVLLSDFSLQEMLDSGLVKLFVSIDAHTEETYRKIRGDGFQQVRENLLNLVEQRRLSNALFPVFRVSFVDMDINREDKEGFVRFWRDKVDFVDVQRYGRFSFDLDKLDRTLPKKNNCVSPLRRLAIRADGTILPCCSFWGDLIDLGNIHQVTLEEAWNCERMQMIRDAIWDDSLDVCACCLRY